jgi:hypothetical protein
MEMRKVYINLTVKLVLNVDDGVEISDVVNELDYEFGDNTGLADVIDTEILDHEVIDSK